ncbi:MAG: DUF2723 domain-containing protein [Saprospiraceae bacterium]
MKKIFNLTGFLIFLITFAVFYMSAERVGSLWDCGEFILGAYKLQVVHPPGAPLFLLIGRLFTWVASVVSDDPADIAFAINLMSSMATSLAAMFTGWSTMMLGKLSMVGREGKTTSAQNLALGFGGLVAGLATAFTISIWFSAVEGEVYAMALMFTAMTFWAATKWYYLPDTKDTDRWLVLTLFVAGLSIGVHLLSILTFPAICLLYYYKKYKKITPLGLLISMGIGLGIIVFIMKGVIVMIPTLWKNFELLCVNSLGMPVHSGLIPTIAVLVGLSYFLLRYAHKNNKYLLQLFTVSAILITLAFSTIGTVVIRANADTPVNMNVPSDATRLLPYLNREQYGERALVMGPHYDAKPIKVDREERYGLVDGKYKIVDEKFTYVYANKDKMLFPRVGHSEASRPDLHRLWRAQLNDGVAPKGKPGMGYNLQFLAKYQFSWMYVRYFMWNFVGKQNGEQGYYPWDVKDGHWKSGIKAFDDAKLYNTDEVPDTIKNNKANNSYYFLPLIFGFLGLLWHFSKSKREFFAILILFILTGIAHVIYANEPPNEPRERDYIFAGSFMIFSMWMGMGVFAFFEMFKNGLKNKLPSTAAATLAGALVLSAPIIMAFQNFDDMSRADITASRDYAANFLNSVAPNSILFTYGDNDTYPLWYAQEVEGIRTDVRVVNLSLIAVDWYINKLRNKVNDSAPIKLSIPANAIRGKKRNQVFFHNFENPQDKKINKPTPIKAALKYIADPRNEREGQTILNTKNIFIPINEAKYRATGMLGNIDSLQFEKTINIKFSEGKSYMTKDDLAVMDIIGSNFYDRPIYFATTCRNEKLLGLNDYMQLEGLALRLTPFKQKSDRSLAIYGSGRIDEEIVYKNVMEKWVWGNFDNKDLFVDRNYMAEIQAMKMAILRASLTFSQKGEHKKAADLAKKYFEGFPHMNFTYDASIIPFINVLVNAKEFDEAKKHLRILGEESRQYMKFYQSLDADDLHDFQQEMGYTSRAVQDVLSISKSVQDPAFVKEMEDKLKIYSISQIRN